MSGTGKQHSQEIDYLIQGGQPTLGVDTESTRNMSRELAAAAEELEELNDCVETEYARLQELYWRRLNSLVFLSGSGDGRAAEEISQLRVAWNRFSSLAHLARHGNRGIRSLSQETASLGCLLARASGEYELSELRVAQLLSPSLVEISLMQLSTRLVEEIGFPTMFRVGEQEYYAKDLNDVQKAAVFLSWLQEKLGEKHYGESRSVTLRSRQGETRIQVAGFEDSPELDTAFGVYLRASEQEGSRFSPRDLREALLRWHGKWGNDPIPPSRPQDFSRWASHLSDPVSTLKRRGEQVADLFHEFSRGKKPQEALVMNLVASISAWLARNQENSRRQRNSDFSHSLTARAIGVTEKQRLELKTLGVGSSGGLVENPDGSVTRNFPRNIGDIYRYAQTIDPKDGAAFEVQQWETSTGKKGVRVILRGTDSWDAGSSQLQDMLTNTESVAGLPTGMHQAVTQALQQLQISRDTPVELVGHSQAGIVAANLAADRVFTKRFKVRNVITAGSPVANARVAPHIRMLNLHNNGDIVPQTEGKTNRVSPKHLTVRADYTMTTDVAKNHDMVESYGAMADDLQGKHYAKYDNYLECRDKELGLDGRIVKATSQRFEVARNFIPPNSKAGAD